MARATNPRVKPPSPGTLPPHGREILASAYENAKANLARDGVRGKALKSRASRIAWCAVKREYYKRGKRWHRRAEHEAHPPGCMPLRNPSGSTAWKAYRAAVAKASRALHIATDRARRRYHDATQAGTRSVLELSREFQDLSKRAEDAYDAALNRAEDDLERTIGRPTKRWERNPISGDKALHARLLNPF